MLPEFDIAESSFLVIVPPVEVEKVTVTRTKLELVVVQT